MTARLPAARAELGALLRRAATASEHLMLSCYPDEASRSGARAEQAGRFAAHIEKMRGTVPEAVRGLREDRALVHRRMQRRHPAVASLYLLQAAALRKRIEQQGEPAAARDVPVFIDVLLSAIRTPSVCVKLESVRGAVAATASDPVAQSAHDREVLVGEGPAQTCEAVGPLRVDADEARSRWPLYATVVERFGVEEVAAVPVRAHELTLGSITALGTSAKPIRPSLRDLRVLGDAVGDMLMFEMKDPAMNSMGLLESVKVDEALHQAAGIASIQYGCSISDALALLRAHAFSSDGDLRSVASAVISGDLSFER